jgi:CTP synthase (UTP-ammonia lyase)
LSFELNAEWVPTVEVNKILSASNYYDGTWIVPGSPYKNDEGVFAVIREAREKNIPILGSCGGFQYMVLEYAKNVLNIQEANHEETNPGGISIISKLHCSLKGQQERVEIKDKNSWLYEVLKEDEIVGLYYCSYGVNPQYFEKLNQPPFTFTAFSSTGEVRAFELKGHRFFNGTLFQPSLDSSFKTPNPLLVNFFNICSRKAIEK